jgi:hypothetical protein
MAYFIFSNNDIDLNLYKIAENDSDLNSLNINLASYKIITVSEENFLSVKFSRKQATRNGDSVSYTDTPIINYEASQMPASIKYLKSIIQIFLDNNATHSQFAKWKNYYNQLSSLDVDTLPNPLTVSIEEYFANNNLISLSPLQLP